MKADGVRKPAGAASSQREAESGRTFAGAARGNTGGLPFDFSMVPTAGAREMTYLSHRQDEERLGAWSTMTEHSNRLGLHHSETA